jgi:hypothetical protein
MARILGMAVASAAALAAGSAGAQSNGEATIYSNGHFRGGSLSFSGPLTRIDPPFTARSVKVSPGSAWEFCSGNTFSGCKRVDKSLDATILSVRSARPIAPVITTAIGPGGAVGALNLPNQALRGFASEFFVAPNQGGKRVGVPNNNPAGMSGQADQFCIAAGWQGSAYARLQNVGGTYFLIDVLCANRDR